MNDNPFQSPVFTESKQSFLLRRRKRVPRNGFKTIFFGTLAGFLVGVGCSLFLVINAADYRMDAAAVASWQNYFYFFGLAIVMPCMLLGFFMSSFLALMRRVLG